MHNVFDARRAAPRPRTPASLSSCPRSPYHCPPGLRERFDLIPPASHGFGSFYEDPSLVLLSKRMNAVNAATAEYIDLLVSPGKRKLQKKKKRRPYMR